MSGWHYQNRGGMNRSCGHGGVFFLPFIPLIIGLMLVVFIFKSGLWIPLLLIGALLWYSSQRNREQWREKAKRNFDWWQRSGSEWSDYREYNEYDDLPHKPKRGGDSEFV